MCVALHRRESVKATEPRQHMLQFTLSVTVVLCDTEPDVPVTVIE